MFKASYFFGTKREKEKKEKIFKLVHKEGKPLLFLVRSKTLSVKTSFNNHNFGKCLTNRFLPYIPRFEVGPFRGGSLFSERSKIFLWGGISFFLFLFYLLTRFEYCLRGDSTVAKILFVLFLRPFFFHSFIICL